MINSFSAFLSIRRWRGQPMFARLLLLASLFFEGDSSTKHSNALLSHIKYELSIIAKAVHAHDIIDYYIEWREKLFLRVTFDTSYQRPFHLTLEGIRLCVNEIASFSRVFCKAIFGLKCIELMGFFSIFEASLYRNYIAFSNKLNTIIRAIFVLFNSPSRLHIWRSAAKS